VIVTGLVPNLRHPITWAGTPLADRRRGSRAGTGAPAPGRQPGAALAQGSAPGPGRRLVLERR
jgi:hypothetical protein